MTPKPARIPERLRAWIIARQRHGLSHAQVQMARELGMNPKKLGKLDNAHQQPWKLPLPAFIESLYQKRFGREYPERVESIEEQCRLLDQKKAARRAAQRSGREAKPLGKKAIKRGPGAQFIEGKDFQLAEEIGYIQRRAAEHDGCLVSVGPLVLFSTESGDAWLLDAEDHLACRLARDGDPQDVYFEETESRFAIGWQGQYRIDGDAFVYIEKDSGRVITILGYPLRQIAGSS
jgi:hypothetical protein